MSGNPTVNVAWRAELPSLVGRTVLLREVASSDLGAIVDLLSVCDSTHSGIDDPISEVAVQDLIERAARERAAGLSFTYVITLAAARTVIGLVQVRQLDPMFEAAEWECTIAPSARGSGIFLETARLVRSFPFGTIGTHRIQARGLLLNRRANGALRKPCAVQEGVPRRAARRPRAERHPG